MDFWAFSYHLPANPSRCRVALWKALGRLGAIYLQPAVAVVPQQEGMQEALHVLKAQVLKDGGTAAIYVLQCTETPDEQALLRKMQEARTTEYTEIAEDAQRLLAQLAWETERGAVDMARYAPIGAQLKRRLAAAIAHDFFNASGRETAQKEVQRVMDVVPSKARAPRKPTAPIQHVSSPSDIQENASVPVREMPVFLF